MIIVYVTRLRPRGKSCGRTISELKNTKYQKNCIRRRENGTGCREKDIGSREQTQVEEKTQDVKKIQAVEKEPYVLEKKYTGCREKDISCRENYIRTCCRENDTGCRERDTSCREKNIQAAERDRGCR